MTEFGGVATGTSSPCPATNPTPTGPTASQRAGIERSLEALVAAGSVIRKEFGKTAKLWWANQDAVPVLTAEEVARLEEELARLADERAGLTAEVKAARARVSAAEGRLSSSALDDAIAEAEARVALLRAEAEALKREQAKIADAGAAAAPEEDEATLQARFDAAAAWWRRARSLCRTIFDAVTENSEEPMKKLQADMGVNDDKAAGVDLYELVTALGGGDGWDGRLGQMPGIMGRAASGSTTAAPAGTKPRSASVLSGRAALQAALRGRT